LNGRDRQNNDNNTGNQMQLHTSALCRSLLLACAITSASAAHAQTPVVPVNGIAERPPVEAFFANPKFSGAILSPSGKYIAARAGAEGQRDMLIVVDLATNSGKVVAAYQDADINTFRWVNDERLVFNVSDKDLGPGDERYAPGLFAVNRDGSQLVQLADRFFGAKSVGRTIQPYNTFLLDEAGPQSSEWIYVARPQVSETRKVRHVTLLRLNTLTGQTETVPSPSSVVQGYMLDQKGEPRLASGTEKNLTTLWYREPASGEWRKLLSFNPYDHSRDNISPVSFGPDGTLYVTSHAGKDTTSLYTFNFATNSINPDPLIVTAAYDFNGKLIMGKDKVLGLQFTTDALSQEWLDPRMKALQAEVDKALPATNNLLSDRAKSPWALVVAYSDVSPASYWLYNKETKQLNKVGDTHPAINPRQMGHQQPIRYAARDGLSIPALLTMPPGSQKTNLPLVVLVHGGPWVNGAAWQWNRESQFLASRGYAVLEPSFRGTRGLGSKHFLASFKQWGKTMQDDVADGTRYLISKGLVDPKRICIAGASYGGYATLMGLVNDPDLYKCGFEWVGVTDINLMYKGSWNFESDMTDEWKQYGMPEMIGDQVKDAAQLKATSPIENAARITQPVLMAYGGVDVRVPMYHGKQFYDAVTKTNKNVEWIEYPDEGHGWRVPKNNYDFWTRVDKFLDKNIGPASQKQQ
jgi:dipeptidyl aminopeptidase/acylaminoacyl peptidase